MTPGFPASPSVAAGPDRCYQRKDGRQTARAEPGG